MLTRPIGPGSTLSSARSSPGGKWRYGKIGERAFNWFGGRRQSPLGVDFGVCPGPEANVAVGGGGGEILAVGRECEAEDGTAMPAEREQRRAGVGLPEPHGPIGSAGGDSRAIGAEADRMNGGEMPREPVEMDFLDDAPEVADAIWRHGYQSLCHRVEGKNDHAIAVGLE